MPEPLWRLDELASRCQMLVDRLGLNVGDSRRVRWEPSPRLLRYYTTLGLLDRAARMVGRTAYYNRRHLLQLLSIKHLQQQGQSLQEIQAALLGKPDMELMANLGLDPDFELPSAEAPPPTLPETAPRARFWENPGQLPELAPLNPPTTKSRTLLEIALAPGLHLTIDKEIYPDVDLSDLDLESLLKAIKIHEWRK